MVPAGAEEPSVITKLPTGKVLNADRAVCTNPVVASCVVLVPGAAVGAEGVPEKVGLARLALTKEVVPRDQEAPLLSSITESPGYRLTEVTFTPDRRMLSLPCAAIKAVADVVSFKNRR